MSRTQLATISRMKKYPARISTAYCPTCNAKPGEWCKTKDGRISRYAHSSRGLPSKNTLPDLTEWWEEMKQYEGLHPKPRPKDLQV